MKKLFVLAGLTLLTSNAYATRARLAGMAEEVADGTFIIEDDRAIFRNVSMIHDYADQAMVEWGGATTATSSAYNADSNDTQKPQGGFLKSHGNYTYGIYLGNESNTANLLRLSADNQVTSSTTTLNKQDNITEFMFGGKGAVNWGAGFTYAKSENTSAKTEDTTMAVHVGANAGAWEAYANVGLKGESKNDTTNIKFEGDGSYHLGGAYTMGSNKVFVSWKNAEWKNTNNSTEFKGEFTRIDAGYGRNEEVGKGTLRYGLRYNSIDVKLANSTNTTTFERGIFRAHLSYEAMAASWLKLRGGVTSIVYGDYEQKNLGNMFSAVAKSLLATGYGQSGNYADGTYAFDDSTDVAAGATLILNKVEIDGLLGYALGAPGSDNGKLNGNQFMSRVGMTYKF